MKRSRINAIMAEADDMIRAHGFTLPPFAYWSPCLLYTSDAADD